MASVSSSTFDANPLIDPSLLAAAAGWDRAASKYNESSKTITTPTAVWALDKVLSLLQSKQPIALADIACGTGALAHEAATRVKQVSSVIASDYSAGMCRIFDEKVQRLCSDNNGNIAAVRTIVADAQDLSSIPDASVDAVFCIFGLFIVPSPARAMREFIRICKPGGYICIATWATFDRSQLHGLLRSIGKHVVAKKSTASAESTTSATPSMPIRIPFSLASDYESLFAEVSLPLISVEEHHTLGEEYPSARAFIQAVAGSAPLGVMAYNEIEQELAIQYLSDIWGAESPFTLSATAMVAIGRKHY